jgi:hypothetical protein
MRNPSGFYNLLLSVVVTIGRLSQLDELETSASFGTICGKMIG